MNKKLLSKLSLAVIFALLFSSFAFAEPVFTEDSSFEAGFGSGDGGISVTSISNPTMAKLAVGTTSYAAPNPSTGHAQEVVPVNTEVWVVEKVYCSYNKVYYYYAGYTYNGASHRGYFHEDNVYVNGSKLMPSNVADQTIPANLKTYTSLSGTVYDGPGTTYSQMGSVGQETVKLIRTEKDYNFIEYTVTGTGKLKRGYLHYSRITGSWASLSAESASLNSVTFYVKNVSSGYYMQTQSDVPSAGSHINIASFDGNKKQLFKFTYDSAGKFFYIKPVSCNSAGYRLSISTAYTNHADRQLTANTSANADNQKFWIVNVGGNKYKILPLSGYGTMSLTERNNYVNQYYTKNGTGTDDTWIFELPVHDVGTTYYSQEGKNWCWVASAKSMASSESNFNNQSLAAAVTAVYGDAYNIGGDVLARAQAANYFTSQNINSGRFIGKKDKIYSEPTIRKILKSGHAVGLSLESPKGDKHAITIYKFDWVESKSRYYYYYYDSRRTPNDYLAEYPQLLNGANLGFADCTWRSVCAYNISYALDYINP